MNTPTFTVQGNWHNGLSSVDIDPEAQTVAGRHAHFVFPVPPEPVRVATPPTRTPYRTRWSTNDAIDDFFGVTRPRATRESPHDSHLSLGSKIPPPPYADANLPAYSADPNTEPVTLAMYLFKFGFLFPPFWVLGAMMLISPLTAPVDFEPSKSGRERQQVVEMIRDVEVRWATRCVWALSVLLVLVGVVGAIFLAVLGTQVVF